MKILSEIIFRLKAGNPKLFTAILWICGILIMLSYSVVFISKYFYINESLVSMCTDVYKSLISGFIVALLPVDPDHEKTKKLTNV